MFSESDFSRRYPFQSHLIVVPTASFESSLTSNWAIKVSIIVIVFIFQLLSQFAIRLDCFFVKVDFNLHFRTTRKTTIGCITVFFGWL